MVLVPLVEPIDDDATPSRREGVAEATCADALTADVYERARPWSDIPQTAEPNYPTIEAPCPRSTGCQTARRCSAVERAIRHRATILLPVPPRPRRGSSWRGLCGRTRRDLTGTIAADPSDTRNRPRPCQPKQHHHDSGEYLALPSALDLNTVHAAVELIRSESDDQIRTNDTRM